MKLAWVRDGAVGMTALRRGRYTDGRTVARLIREAPVALDSAPSLIADAWTSPRSDRDVAALLGALPAVQRVVCVQAAAQLALPIWLSVSRRYGLTRTHLRAPARAIELVDCWLSGRSPMRLTMIDARQDALDAGEELDMSSITPASCAAYLAASAVDSARRDGEIHYAPGWAIATIAEHDDTIYARWWSRCRARLAFADAPTADLQ